MDAQVVHAKRPFVALLLVFVAGIATWFVYVPIHELLHALGCYITGGAVSTLEIAPEYGGALLAHVFPFVVSGGDYAGRLSGFDTHGSDLVYLATDALPFLLTITVGVPLLKASTARHQPVRFGAAVVVALAPFYSLIGDYYEMGSIVVTRAATVLRGGATLAYASLRSDDVILLVSRLWSQPHELQLDTPGAVTAGFIVVGLAFALGTLLAFATYFLGSQVAHLTLHRAPSATP